MDEQNKKRVYCHELALSDGIAFEKIVEMLFDECDSVNLYAECSDLADDKPFFAELTPVIGLVTSSELTQEKKLKITFPACEELKRYFIEIRSLCATLKDGSMQFAPYVYFSDTEFVRSGEAIVNLYLKTNRIKAEPGIAAKAAAIYAQSMPLDPDYLKIRSNFERLPYGRRRYYLNVGIRLVKNLLLYCKREKATREKSTAQIMLINKLLPKKEWITAAAYKRLVTELFVDILKPELDFCESFSDICALRPKIEKCLRKLEFYLGNELNEQPQERSYYS